jgi:hypothetical protein
VLTKRAKALGMDLAAYTVMLIEAEVRPALERKDRRSLPEIFADSPLAGLELDFSRNRT